MADLTMERLDEWLHPPEHELSGLATSEEEFEYLRAQAYGVRRRFVVDAATHTMDHKAAGEECDDMTFFASLPARNYIDHKDYKIISNFAVEMMENYVLLAERSSYWRKLTELQALLDGFVHTRNKYDDKSYLSEDNFDNALALSNEIRESDYPVRFFMRGAKFVGQAALNLDTMRDWVEGQTNFDPEAYLYQWHRYLFPAKYTRPSSLGDTPGIIDWPFVRDQMKNWSAVLAAKDIGDKHVPWLVERQTFADCVTVLAPGLYLAPYIPEEVTRTRNFVDYDDVRHAAIEAGETKLTATSSTFNDLAYVALAQSSTLDNWQRYRIREEHISAPAASIRPGVIFMSRSVAEEIVHHIDQNFKNRRVVRAVGAALLDQRDDVFNSYNRLDVRLLH